MKINTIEKKYKIKLKLFKYKYLNKPYDVSFWYRILKSEKELSHSFFEKYQNYIDWDTAIEYHDIPRTLLFEYFHSFDPYILAKYGKLTDETHNQELKHEPSYSFELVESKYGLKIYWAYFLFYKYSDFMDWDAISKYQKLDNVMIDIFSDKVNWEEICIHQNLSEELMEKYVDRLNWDAISINQKLSYDFILKYKDKLNWKFISYFRFIDESMFDEISKYFVWKIKEHDPEILRSYYFVRNKDYIYSNFYNNIDLYSHNFISENIDKLNWSEISKSRRLNESFVRKFHKYLSFKHLYINNNFSESFFIDYEEKIIWDNLTVFDKVPENLMFKYVNAYNLDFIAEKIILSNKTLKKLPQLFTSHNLFNNKTLTENLIWEYAETIFENHKAYKLLQSKKLSETFLRKYSYYASDNPHALLFCQNVSENFIWDYKYLFFKNRICNTEKDIYFDYKHITESHPNISKNMRKKFYRYYIRTYIMYILIKKPILNLKWLIGML